MNTTPNFVQTYTIATARVTAASIRTGASNYTLLVTAGVNGSKIDKIDVIGANLNSIPSQNKMLFFYIKNGSEYILIREQRMYSATPGTTIYGTVAIVYFDGGLILSASQELYVGISFYGSVSDNVDFVAEVKNF